MVGFDKTFSQAFGNVTFYLETYSHNVLTNKTLVESQECADTHPGKVYSDADFGLKMGEDYTMYCPTNLTQINLLANKLHETNTILNVEIVRCKPTQSIQCITDS